MNKGVHVRIFSIIAPVALLLTAVCPWACIVASDDDMTADAGATISTSTSTSTGATVTGTVTFTGEAPPARIVPVNKDEEVCGCAEREIFPVRADEQGRLQDVVVFLDSKEIEFEWDHPAEGYVLNQKGCRFDPYVLVLPRDPKASLRVVNSDPVLHNIHAYEIMGRSRRGLFNIGQPAGAEDATPTMRVSRRGRAVSVKCDAHDFMGSWIFIADNPFYAVVAEDGTFEIKDIPSGTYTVGAWHPYLDLKKQEITIEEGANVVLNFTFEPVKKRSSRGGR